MFFGTIKEVSIGPTSLMALLTMQYTHGKPPEFAIILAFLAGCVEFAMGVLKLGKYQSSICPFLLSDIFINRIYFLDAGFVVDFISVPVTSAFTSATSLIIVGAQLKNIFGYDDKTKEFIDSIKQLAASLPHISLGDLILSIGCCVFLLILRVSFMDVKIASIILMRFIFWFLFFSKSKKLK